MCTTYCHTCGKFTEVVRQYYMCVKCLEDWYNTKH